MATLIVAIAIAPALAVAEPPGSPEARGALRVYLDDDRVTVVSPSASVNAPLGTVTTVAVDATADAISSASIDVLSAASPVEVRELRVELGARLARALARSVELRAQARGSHEADYLALRGGAGAELQLAARTVVLALDYQLGVDRVGDVTDDAFARRRTIHTVTLGVTRVLDPRTLLDVTVEPQLAAGYHASPYRRVPIIDEAWPLPTWVDEVTPARRRSVAIAVRGRRALGSAWFVGAAQRVYVDDWAMSSHTTTLEVRHQADDAWLLGATARGSLQGGADFYRRAYVGAVPAERTRDRTLGPMRSVFVSVAADRALGAGAAHVVVAGGVLAMWFLDSASQARRLAVVTTLSLVHGF